MWTCKYWLHNSTWSYLYCVNSVRSDILINRGSRHYSNIKIVITIWFTVTKYSYHNVWNFYLFVYVFFPLSLPRHLFWLYLWVTQRGLIRRKNCLHFTSTSVHPGFFGAVCVTHPFSFNVVLLCVFMFLVRHCTISA